jgi:hypothetical protein
MFVARNRQDTFHRRWVHSLWQRMQGWLPGIPAQDLGRRCRRPCGEHDSAGRPGSRAIFSDHKLGLGFWEKKAGQVWGGSIRIMRALD